MPSQETSLVPGPHTQLPTDQAAPTVRNAVAQAADTPVDHHTHPASPAAPDAAQLSASLKPDSTDQPDTSKGLVPLCSGKNNATAAAATDGQQAPLPVSALRQHSRKRPIETDSVCTASQADTASPAPNRSHGARKQKSRKPAPSFQPGAEAGDVTADVSTAQQSQLKPTAPAEPLDEPSAEPLPEPSAEPSSEPSAEPSSQPQLSPQPQQWVEPDPADHPHALLPVSHEASAQKAIGNPSQTPSLSPRLSNRPIMMLNLRLKASSSLKLLLSPSAPKFWPQIHPMLCYSLRLKVSSSLNLMSASAPKFCPPIHLMLCCSLRLKASSSLNLMSVLASKFCPKIHLTLSHSLNSTACQKLPVWLWPLVPYHTVSSSPSCGAVLGPSLSSKLLLSLSLLANLSMSPNV